MSGQYTDFIVVVTGASTGLGRAVALEVAAQGAKAVVINYAHNRDDAEETARLVGAFGAETVVVQGDVANDEDCRRIAAAAEPFGRIDALFNNAGTTKFAGHADLDAVSAQDFLDLYAVNVVGAFQMVRSCRSLLEAAPQPGAVVMTASIAGVTGIGSHSPPLVTVGIDRSTEISTLSVDSASIRLMTPVSSFSE